MALLGFLKCSLVKRSPFSLISRSSSSSARHKAAKRQRHPENAAPQEEQQQQQQQQRVKPWKEKKKREELQVGRKYLSDDVAIAENFRERLKRTYESIELKKQKLQKYDFPEDKPVHDPEYLSPDFMTALRVRNRCIDDFLTIGKRGIWEGFVRDIYSHWKNHETLRIYLEHYPLRKLRPMAEEVAKMSGSVVINVTEETMSFILYRGRNFELGHMPAKPIENMLDKQKALERTHLLKSLQQLYINVHWLTGKIQKHRAKAEYTEKQRKASIANAEKQEQEGSLTDEEFQW